MASQWVGKLSRGIFDATSGMFINEYVYKADIERNKVVELKRMNFTLPLTTFNPCTLSLDVTRRAQFRSSGKE